MALHHSYADDTVLYMDFEVKSRANLITTVDKLERCMQDVVTWMGDNRLKLNTGKTEAVIFGAGQHVSRNIDIRVGEATVTPSQSLRNLGVIIDKDMHVTQQISTTCRATYYNLRRINKIKRYMNGNALKMVVHSIITGRLDYCNSLYFGLPQCQTKKLQCVQNSAARLITNTGRREHITPVLKALHWLPIRSRTEYKTLIIIFKSLLGVGPSYISDLLQWYVPPRPLRSKSTPALIPVNSRGVKLNRRLLSAGAANLWNNLPKRLRTIRDLPSFKRHLKTHIFSKTFHV